MYPIRRYARAIDGALRKSHEIVSRKAFSLAKLALLPRVVAAHPRAALAALPLALAVDAAKAGLVARMTASVEALETRLRLMRARRERVRRTTRATTSSRRARHRAAGGPRARRGARSRPTRATSAAQGRSEPRAPVCAVAVRSSALCAVSLALRELVRSQAHTRTPSLSRSYWSDVLGPGIEVMLAFLLERRLIGVGDLHLFSRVIEDAIDLALTKSRAEAELASIATDAARLDELAAALELARASRARVACAYGGVGRLALGGEFLRGQRAARDGATPRTRVAIERLAVAPGRVVAVTGANGCGKSTTFALLSSCARDGGSTPRPRPGTRLSAPLHASIEVTRSDATVLVPDGDVVELTQTTYCPLYTTPLEWLAQPSLDYWLALDGDAGAAALARGEPRVAMLSDATRARLVEAIEELAAELNFRPAATLAVEESARSEAEREEAGACHASSADGAAAPSSCPAGARETTTAAPTLVRDELDVEKEDWYAELSGGQRSKAELIRRVFLRPSCPRTLLVDEALAPLDPTSRATVQARLRAFCAARGSLVLVIHHDDDADDGSADGPGCVDSNGGFFDDVLQFANGTAELVGTCDSRARA